MKVATSWSINYFNAVSIEIGTAKTFDVAISVGYPTGTTASFVAIANPVGSNSTAVSAFNTAVPIGFNSMATTTFDTPNLFEANATGLAILNTAIPAGSNPTAVATFSTADLSRSAATGVAASNTTVFVGSDTTIESSGIAVCYNSVTPSLAGLQTAGTSSFNPAYSGRYTEIKQELSALSRVAAEGNPIIEIGAIDTAHIVLNYLLENQFPPPQITSMGADAIVMLWTSGDAAAAVTITDGELGHIIRRSRKTIKRQSNIRPEEFDLLSST